MWAQAGMSTDNSTIIILLPASERSWNQQLNSTEKVFIVNKFHKCKWANEKLLCFTLWCSASMCCSASSVFNRPHASGAFVLSGVLQLLLRQNKTQQAVRDLRELPLLWQIIMPQRLTDVPELHGKYTTFFLFGLEKGKKSILFSIYLMDFLFCWGSQLRSCLLLLLP